MFVSTFTLFKYLFFRLHFFHWEKVQLFYVDKVIPIVNICSGVSDMYEGNGKIFFILFSREKGSLHLFGTFQGNSIKCIFGKLSARKDRRLQKQGVIRVKLREKVGFPAWTRLVKHRLCLQHSACMLLTVCSLGHTSKCLTKVEGCTTVRSNSGRESLMMEFRGNIPLLVQSCHSTRNSLI